MHINSLPLKVISSDISFVATGSGGPSGVGKSSKVWKDYGDSLFDKAQNKWFDGYASEETILLDDFDKKGICLSHYLKRWADHYPCTSETKGGTVHLRHKCLVITSQYSISKLSLANQMRMVL